MKRISFVALPMAVIMGITACTPLESGPARKAARIGYENPRAFFEIRESPDPLTAADGRVVEGYCPDDRYYTGAREVYFVDPSKNYEDFSGRTAVHSAVGCFDSGDRRHEDFYSFAFHSWDSLVEAGVLTDDEAGALASSPVFAQGHDGLCGDIAVEENLAIVERIIDDLPDSMICMVGESDGASS